MTGARPTRRPPVGCLRPWLLALAPTLALLQALGAASAGAQGIDATGTFHHHMGTQRLSSVALSTVEPPYRWLVGLGYAYGRSPLMATHTGLVGTRNLVADQHMLSLQLVLGLPRVQVGLAFPMVVYQTGEPWTDANGGSHGEVHWFALADMRLHAKVMLLDPRRWGPGIALSASLAVPSGHSTRFAGGTAVVFRPRLVIDYWHKRLAYLAMNVCYVLRKAERFGQLVIDDQIELSFGVMVRFGVLGRPFYLFGEIVAATQVRDPFQVEGGTPVEGRFGIRLWNSDNFFAEIAWGAALRRADGLPRYRVMTNLGLTFLMPGMGRVSKRPPDRDGDGVPDGQDACPSTPEDLDGFEDADGCPEPGGPTISMGDRQVRRRPSRPRWWQRWRQKRAKARAARAARRAARRPPESARRAAGSQLSKRLQERSKRLAKTIEKIRDKLKRGSSRVKRAAKSLGKKLHRARPRPRRRMAPRSDPPPSRSGR